MRVPRNSKISASCFYFNHSFTPFQPERASVGVVLHIARLFYPLPQRATQRFLECLDVDVQLPSSAGALRKRNFVATERGYTWLQKTLGAGILDREGKQCATYFSSCWPIWIFPQTQRDITKRPLHTITRSSVQATSNNPPEVKMHDAVVKSVVHTDKAKRDRVSLCVPHKATACVFPWCLRNIL